MDELEKWAKDKPEFLVMLSVLQQLSILQKTRDR